MSEGCCATTATLQSVASETFPHCKELSLTYIASIEPAGVENVYDVEIEGTENFIANGLVSHNTRWHEDDLSGWLLFATSAVSSDGTVIVGTADHDDQVRAYVITGFFVCPADLNADGLVDFGDYLEFLNLYDAEDPRADFNDDGLIDFNDYLEFLNRYDAGC